MIRQILFFENHFLDFYKVQDEKVKFKIKNVLELIRQVDRVPEKFLKHVSEVDGLYEIRIEFNSNMYRIFCCFDKGNLVILLNAYQKKTQKIPLSVLERAKKLKFDYFKKNKK
ncbi:MAG: type II toxin-antitoxin system RelE/ParE family toxin [Saprospiraceae bacterium]|nr:type II toxin-antitoxin system RelE/ParE family toxin [Saprospiraceae bacterium]